jgi:hypothetical protein
MEGNGSGHLISLDAEQLKRFQVRGNNRILRLEQVRFAGPKHNLEAEGGNKGYLARISSAMPVICETGNLLPFEVGYWRFFLYL